MAKGLGRKIAYGVSGGLMLLSAGTCTHYCSKMVDSAKNSIVISYSHAEESLENLESKKSSLLERSTYVPVEFYSNSGIDKLNDYVSPKKEVDSLIVNKIDSAIYETRQDLDSIASLPEYKSSQREFLNNWNKVKYSTFGFGVSLLALAGFLFSNYLRKKEKEDFVKNG